MKTSEIIVVIIVIAALIAGGRYYFFVYLRSPAYALGEYLGAVKAGNVQRQYALLDDADKQVYATQRDYEKGEPLARGYTERISAVTFAQPVPDPKNPEKRVTIETTISLRKSGQEVYQTATDTYTDKYTMRKDSEGKWKVWLSKSVINMKKATPNPPGDPIGN